MSAIVISCWLRGESGWAASSGVTVFDEAGERANGGAWDLDGDGGRGCGICLSVCRWQLVPETSKSGRVSPLDREGGEV